MHNTIRADNFRELVLPLAAKHTSDTRRTNIKR